MGGTRETIARGLYFGESPRWHDGELWFSDIHGQRVHRMVLGAERQEVLHLEDDLPSGLGWLPDGRLLVVAMDTQQLRRLEPDGTVSRHADLAGVATGTMNDMVVGPDGTAYVGDTGWRLWDGAGQFAPGRLVVVSADGAVVQVVDGLMAPNGMALAGDTLVLAEPGAARLTAFRVAGDGTLVDQRTFAALEASAPIAPDGICADEEGAIWLADPIGRRAVRVLDGGAVTDVLEFDELPVACVLAGTDRRTLVVCVAPDWHREAALREPLAHLEAFDVAVPGTGTP
jgi:sugar lactone lactonase YvrE